MQKKRHYDVPRAIHWALSGKYGLEKWHDYVPYNVLKIENSKLFWSFSVTANPEIGREDVVNLEDGRIRVKEPEM